MTTANTSAPDDDAILAQADEIRATRAAAAKAACEEKFAPLLAFRSSEAFGAVMAQLGELAPAFNTEPAVYQNLTAMQRIMSSLDLVIPAEARPAPAA